MIAVSLLIVLAVSRLAANGGHHVDLNWWSPFAYLWHDAVLVLAFAVVEAALRSHRRVTLALYAILALYVVLNIPIQRALWSPLTWTMWQAAGGPLADSIRHYATLTNVALLVAGLTTIATAPIAARRVPLRPVLIVVLACAVLGPFAARRVDTRGAERNAWSGLAETLVRRPAGHVVMRDWRASDLAATPDVDLRLLRGAAAGANVVLVSLESTAARYLGLYGAVPDVAPNLSALASSHAVVFENAYAVYPESIKGLFSVLCSVAPGFDTTAESYVEVPCRSLAAVLRTNRYRTALFHSGRFDYLGMNAIVRDRGFDVLADAGDIGGRHDSSFGIDEPSTVDAMLRWIDGGDDLHPFFLAYLPIAGHHPYDAPGRGPFPDRDEFGRYQNALHYGDTALGQLRRGLESRGLMRNTIWIVFGDHGEAFGQHEGNYGHTFQIYDENVHVPFVIAVPGASKPPVRASRIVSLLDTAPTILDLLGLRVPEAYEGSSMLEGRPRTALFFTDYSLPLAGMRDGPRKIIHDLRSGRTEWFDVDVDPNEREDHSSRDPNATRRYADTLTLWTRRVR